MAECGGLLPAFPGSFQPHTRGVDYRYRDGHRQRKRYIRKADLERARAELAAWRAAHPPAWTMRQTLAALRRETRT